MARLDWQFTASGGIYTLPRQFAISRLPNGKWRLFCYGSGLQYLHATRLAALQHASDIAERQAR